MLNKIDKIKKDGYENLQIVLDFDRTITGPVNSEPAPPMISFLRNSDMLGEEYKKNAQANFEHYYKFEKSHELSQSEKTLLMHEWWEKHLLQLVEYKLTKDKIRIITESEHLILRSGVSDFVKFCNINNISVIIFSAGILGSESIMIFLERWGIKIDNLKIIINELVFNDSSQVVGFKEPIITSENKDESVFEVEGIKQKKNTILFGDGISDAQMVVDKDDSVVYRVGILDKKMDLTDENFEVEKNIYLNHFDEVTDNFRDILEKLN
jgi:HAD superfamily hydrolase (TIGR01544 family)